MNQTFKRVILYTRQNRTDDGVSESLHRLIAFLKNHHIAVFQDIETSVSFELKIPILKRDQLGETHDLIVVVGGDGSLLSAARMAVEYDVPVIGINRGRLGFLTDILPQDIEARLGAVLAGDYKEEQRFLLHAHVESKNTPYFVGTALNDVVLSRSSEPHLIDFDVYVDEQLVSHFRSDGLIISTPTGSTAYSLSAGGPIMHPQLDALVMVPMFSHSLSSRPLVFSGEARIELVIDARNENSPRISCDSHNSKLLNPGQRVTIQKNKQTLRLLHPLDYLYYDTLRSKLGWESIHQG